MGRSFASIVVLALASCSSPSVSNLNPVDAAAPDVARATPCTAGMVIACPCTGSGQGTQTCNVMSGVFGPCLCGGVDAGGADVVSVMDAAVDVVQPGTDVSTTVDVQTADTGAEIPPVDTGVDVPPVDTGVDVVTVDVAVVDAGITSPSCAAAGTPGCGFVTIPGGSFTMDEDPMADTVGSPLPQPVTVSTFTLDAYEVTVARFRVFWSAGHPTPPGGMINYPSGSIVWGGPTTVAEPFDAVVDVSATWSEIPANLEAHPVNDVDWYTAQAFCVWDGGRLPTEAEWEYAARGGSAGNDYPWWSGSSGSLPTGALSGVCMFAQWDGCMGEDGTGTKRVGSFPSGSTPTGLHDLAGNVWEWGGDWYAPYNDTTCWNGASRTNPMCSNSATGSRVFRGGSWNIDDVVRLRSASRGSYNPADSLNDVGFRCARSP